MIDLRGGLQGLSFREQRRIYFRFLTYPARSSQIELGDVRKTSVYILQTPTYVTMPATAKPSRDSIKTPGENNSKSYLEAYDSYHECEEFLTHLETYTRLSISRHFSHPLCFPSSPEVAEPLASYFVPPTVLHHILTTPHPNIYPESLLVKDSALLACVLIFHTTLHSLRHSPSTASHYLSKVSSDLAENGLVPHRKTSIEFLLWILLTNSRSLNLTGYDSNLEVGWECGKKDGIDVLPLVLRLVTTARKLKPDGWKKVKETLVAGLVGDLGRVVEASLSWTRGELRAQILGLDVGRVKWPGRIICCSFELMNEPGSLVADIRTRAKK
jgi:hypothetical protein